MTLSWCTNHCSSTSMECTGATTSYWQSRIIKREEQAQHQLEKIRLCPELRGEGAIPTCPKRNHSRCRRWYWLGDLQFRNLMPVGRVLSLHSLIIKRLKTRKSILKTHLSQVLAGRTRSLPLDKPLYKTLGHHLSRHFQPNLKRNQSISLSSQGSLRA